MEFLLHRKLHPIPPNIHYQGKLLEFVNISTLTASTPDPTKKSAGGEMPGASQRGLTGNTRDVLGDTLTTNDRVQPNE